MGKHKSDDFREKEVISITDGMRLGYVSEIEFDICDGCITAIITEGGSCKGCVRIPWDHIKKIGDDIILVDAEGCLPPPPCEVKSRKKWGFI